MVKDYPESDTEEVVLTRFGKLKQWWEIGSTLVKVIKWGILGFKLLFLGSTAAVVVGQAMDEKPLAGMLQEKVIDVPHETAGAGLDYELLLEEMVTLQEEVTALQDHTHDHAHSPHEHDTTHEHQQVSLAHTHPEKPHSHPGAAVGEAAIQAEILKYVPDNHMSLH